ncbi:MAG: hypothetical protein VX871_06790 [Pseudomonadota bacterium]|nr:hypothetical protein [Pseudomonadota bacterium]
MPRVALAIVLALALPFEPGKCADDIKEKMAELRQRISELAKEIGHQHQVIAAMQASLANSYKTGERLDLTKLEAIGQAGTGVIDAGKDKPKGVQEIIAEYESFSNPQNYAGLARLGIHFHNETKPLVEKRKGELGLKPDELLSDADIKPIWKLAFGRAYFKNEIVRSQEYVARIKAEMDDLNNELNSYEKQWLTHMPEFTMSRVPMYPDKKKLVRLELEPTSPPVVALPMYGHDLSAVFLERNQATYLRAWAVYDDGSREEVTTTSDSPQRWTLWSPSRFVNKGHVHIDETGIFTIQATYVEGGDKGKVPGNQTASMKVVVEEVPTLTVGLAANPPSVVAGKDTEVTFHIFIAFNGGISPAAGYATRILDDVKLELAGCNNLKSQIPGFYNAGDSFTASCKQTIQNGGTWTLKAEGVYKPYSRLVKGEASVAIPERPASPDNTPPQLTISSHTNGQQVNTPEITLAGSATDRAKGDNGIWMVFVDDSVVSQSEPLQKTGAGTGQWSKKIDLVPGENRLVVRAHDNSANYNAAEQAITIIYNAPEEAAEHFVVRPIDSTIDIGQSVSFSAWLASATTTSRDVTGDNKTRWISGPQFMAEKAGIFTVTAIHDGQVATATIKVKDPAKPGIYEPGATGDGPEGGLWNILFKPDGTGRPRCYKFFVAKIGGKRVASPGVLTPLGTREGWSVDTSGGAGPNRGWSWSNWKQVNARMTELSVFGDDWYGCLADPQVASPTEGAGQVNPLPAGAIAYGIWRKHHGLDPPNCYQFHSAPVEKSASLDTRSGWEREPGFFGPHDKSSVGAVVSRLSRYGGNYYGCMAGGSDSAAGAAGVVADVDTAISSCDANAISAVAARLAWAGPGPLGDARDRLQRIGAVLSDVNVAFATGNRNYDAGQFTEARGALEQAERALARLGGDPVCPAIRERISGGLGKISKVESVVGKVNEAIEGCDASALSSIRSQLANAGGLPPLLAGKLAEVNRIVPVLDRARSTFNQANEAFVNGDISTARTRVQSARTAIGELGGSPACTGMTDHIDRAVAKINKVESIISDADWAISNCNREQIRDLNARLSAVSDANVALIRKTEELRKAEKDCDSRVAAEANADCERRAGAGYFARMQDDGRYICMPTKAAADDWCRRKNSGSGIHAGPIRADGGFDCLQSAQGERADADADCRREYGNRFRRLVRQNGEWLCEYDDPQPQQPPPQPTVTPERPAPPAAGCPWCKLFDGVADPLTATQGVGQRLRR